VGKNIAQERIKMLFLERLASVGQRVPAQRFGSARLPAVRLGQNIVTFAAPEQTTVANYRLYISLESPNLTLSDTVGLKAIASLQGVKGLIVEDEATKRVLLQTSEELKSVGIEAQSFDDSYIKTYEDFPWYRWTQHPRIVEAVLSGRYEDILPVTSEVVPTLNCTYRCGSTENGAGCSYKEAKKLLGVWDGPNIFKDPRIHMQEWTVMKTVIDRLIEGGVFGLIFTGGGEPFLSRFTLQGIRYAREKGADIELFSNGSVINQKTIDALVTLNLHIIRISLNAGTKEGHLSHHNYLNPNADHFRTVLRNIEALAKARTERKSPRNFGIAYLLSNRNEGNIRKAAEILLSIIDKFPGGIDYITVRAETDHFGTQMMDPLIFERETRIARDIEHEFVERGVSFRFLSRLPEFREDMKGYNTCRALRAFGEVGPSGEMFQCCDRNAHPAYRVGNILTTPVSEIWRSKGYQDLLDKMNASGLSLCPPLCKPHVYNQIFDQIESLRLEGRIKEVEEWIALQQLLPRHFMHNIL